MTFFQFIISLVIFDFVICVIHHKLMNNDKTSDNNNSIPHHKSLSSWHIDSNGSLGRNKKKIKKT